MGKTPAVPIKYEEQPFNRQLLLDNPLDQFALWFDQAKLQGELEPSAMTLATVNRQYDVTARMVLLKSFDQNGFVFFTNYLSPKALSLQEVNKAALVFWWPKCQRQVRITGAVSPIDAKASDEYFSQRSIDSCIATIASKQSAIIPSRDTLIAQFNKVAQDYAGQATIPRPTHWGGYRLQHERIEFWQGRVHRLHDRFEYRKTPQGWEIVQLSP